jgi:uncharacterized protein with GYD domain
MPLFALLTRLSPDALVDPQSVLGLDEEVSQSVKAECPDVKWVANYAVLGPCDYLDIFDAPDADTAAKVALIVRSRGHGTTETWVLTPWTRFKSMIGTKRQAA